MYEDLEEQQKQQQQYISWQVFFYGWGLYCFLATLTATACIFTQTAIGIAIGLTCYFLFGIGEIAVDASKNKYFQDNRIAQALICEILAKSKTLIGFFVSLIIGLYIGEFNFFWLLVGLAVVLTLLFTILIFVIVRYFSRGNKKIIIR